MAATPKPRSSGIPRFDAAVVPTAAQMAGRGHTRLLRRASTIASSPLQGPLCRSGWGVACPCPESGASSEGWVGANGYVRADGSRQRRALAFQGHVVTLQGETVSEVFIVDLPEDLATQHDHYLHGTPKQ